MKEKTVSYLIIASSIFLLSPLAVFVFNVISNLNFEILSLYFSKEMLHLFLYTCFLGFAASVFSTLLGLFIALALEFYEVKFSSSFKALFFILLILPNYFFTFSWLGFLGKRGTLTQFQMPNLPVNVYTPEFLLFTFVISSFPLATLLLMLGIRNIASELIEAGRLFSKRVIGKIIIPLLKPYLLVSFFITFFLFFSEYITPSYLGINLYQNEIFLQLGAFYNLQGAGILSLPLFFVSIVISSLIVYYFKKRNFCVISGEMKTKHAKIITRKEKLIGLLLLLLLSLSLGIPFSMLLIESELSFAQAMNTTKNEILNSILLSLLSSLLTTIFAFLVVLFVKNKVYINFLIFFPFSIPSVLLAISLIHFYQFMPFSSFIPLLHGYIIKFLPYSILFLAAFSEQISKSIEDANKIFVRSLGERFFKIFLPIFKPSLTISFLLVFVLSIGEVSISQLLAPPGFQTLAIKLDILMHYGNYSYVSSLLIFIMFLAFVSYYLMEVKRWKQ